MVPRVPLLIAVLAGWWLAGSGSVSAAPAEHKPPATFGLSAIDAYLAAVVKEDHRVGLSVAILKDGRLVFAKGYGRRSQDGRPVGTNTLFAIGSVSKQFTCACILLLAEEGKLSVQDTVAKYYPQLTRAQDITLLDLMNHVSGYPDYYPLDFVDRRMAAAIDPDELLRRYAGGKLDFEPGMKWSYSNTGYILLGRVVEKVSGESFGSFLQRHILQPLDLTNTVYEAKANDPRLAQGFTTFALSAAQPVAPEASGWLGGAGAIYSTPSDLARWDLALMEGRLLKPESFALMTTSRRLEDGKMTEYGCGVSVRTQAGWPVVSHNGAVSGFNTWNAMVPSTRSAVIMTCNLDGGLGALPGQIFALLLQDPVQVPRVQGPAVTNQVQALFTQLRRGRIDRSLLGEEFNLFLTDQKVTAAAARLKPYRTLKRTEVTNTHERGGMEVTTTLLRFNNGTLRVLMYRRPNGKVEQFFVDPE